MSRHRNFRKMNYDDERDDECDDDDFHRYSISADDEVAMSPGTAQFMYRRPWQASNTPRTNGGNATAKLSDFIPEEGMSYGELENDVVDEPGEQFAMEMKTAKKPERPRPPPSASPFSISRLPETPASKPASVRQRDNKKQIAESKPEVQRLRLPAVENLRIAEVNENKDQRGESPTRPGSLRPNASSRRLSALAAAQATPSETPKKRNRPTDAKPSINLVIVGHVDAGKSTLMGHLLYQMGCVEDRTMHKYKQESMKTGKASFAFAWVLDDTQEERERGVTMDIAKTSFNTEHRRVTILDAPGHKDFIPNMITGAAQADAGLLVVNATRGEFETGFDQGGQTREHAMLIRALGVSELIVAVNKLDTIEWSKERYDEVCTCLKNFLRKQAGFSNVHFVPVSGLEGINLTKKPSPDHPLLQWYNGPTILQLIDELNAPTRDEDRPLRVVINDVLKNAAPTLSLSVKVEAGQVAVGDKVFIMPNADPAIVKGLTADEGADSEPGVCFAGDHALITLSALGNIEPDSITNGQVLCRGGSECLVPGKRFIARIVVFSTVVIPIMKGTRADLFAHSLCEPCTVTHLRSALNKASGEVLKRKPRCLSRNMSGVVEILTDRAVSLESFAECRSLGRVTLRSNGQTIAAGIIEKVLP